MAQIKRSLAIAVVFLLVARAAFPPGDDARTPEPPAPDAPIAAPGPEGRRIIAYTRVQQLRQQMRNPDSFELIRSRGTPDATQLCVVYRAQNGFGGLNVETAALDERGWHIEPGAVRRICRQRLAIVYR